MILQFQKIVVLSENPLIFQGHLLCLVHQSLLDIAGHFSGQTGREGYQALVILFQKLHVHAGLIIIPLREPLAYNLHQIGIAHIVLCQEHQMIIAVLTARQLPVKTGMGRHVNLTADHRVDPRFFGRFIKIDNAVHNAVIRDRGAVHPQFFDIFHIFFDLVGAVQETVFRVDV